MISFFKKIFVLVMGVVSLPLVVPATSAFYGQLAGIAITNSGNQRHFLYGVAAYLAMHLFFFKPKYIYNLGHEVTHAVCAWLSFGRAKNLKVSSKGGSVETIKSNAFINIGPYFVPIYTALLCAAYFAVSRFRDISAYSPYFIFFIGFTFAMHIIMTVEALKISQPDLIKTGYLFSLSMIYVINVFAAGFIISLIFTGFSFMDMAAQFYFDSKDLYICIFRQLFGV